MNTANAKEQRVILIGAMTGDRVIGSGDGMPWDIPEEYQTFVESIRGKTVIMGRRSYEIFGPDLTSSHEIVLSRSETSLDVPVVDSIEEALEKAQDFGEDIFVGGGAAIYRLALPHADWMYLSEIKGDYQGDTYFPEFDEDQWSIELEEDHPRFIYRRFRRIRSG